MVAIMCSSNSAGSSVLLYGAIMFGALLGLYLTNYPQSRLSKLLKRIFVKSPKV